MKRLSDQTDGLFEEDSGLGGSNLTPPKVSRSFETDSAFHFEYQSHNDTACDENWFKSSPFTSFGFNSPRKELKIVKEPERHHRARYMTEGSRGAIKDRSGLGHPVIRLIGYNKGPVTVSCYIGQDKAPFTSPHLFYQASKITSKNSLKCMSTKVEGTTVISFVLRPENGMEAVVDCVGILKERNVDVEHKLQRLKGKKGNDEQGQVIPGLTKKRSTRCRMVFKCDLPELRETLTAVSQPLLCTQPAGCPEICKKSLSRCEVTGGKDLFIIGKNFLKDCKVHFTGDNWTRVVDPDKEHFHSSHIVCKIPRYDGPLVMSREIRGLSEAVCSVSVHSAGKTSELHPFTFFTFHDQSNIVVGQNVPKTLDEFSHVLCNGQSLPKQEPESLQQILFSCQQPQETATNSFVNPEPIPIFQPQVLMVNGNETFQQPDQSEQQQTQHGMELSKEVSSTSVDFGAIRMFPEPNGSGFSTSTSTCQSLNLISQMSESELLGIINPSTFDSV